MNGKVLPFAPTVATASPAQGAIHAAALEGRGRGSSAALRSAHSFQTSMHAAVTVLAGHGHKEAVEAARGDRARERDLLRRNGEIMFLAGLQLIADAEAP